MNEITEIILTALNEDIRSGDITTLATIPEEKTARAEFLIKESEGVIAGIEIVREVFTLVDPALVFTASVQDGSLVKKGDIVAIVEGKASSILTAERTALNFMQRMSGIATTSRKYASSVSHTKALILDTRKTVPGLRQLDKMAVVIGGCTNHRAGLYDMFLIKDNHIAVSGSITAAVEACRKYKTENQLDCHIEVEVKNLQEVSEALSCRADIIMLDNFEIEQMKLAVEIIGEKAKIEASGGVNLDTVKNIAETGVDYISVGALTHSVKAMDISLNIIM